MSLIVSLEGGKRVSTQIGNHRICTDQPLGKGGEDTAPSPFDLFMASLACCAGFFVQSYCEDKCIDTTGISITLVPKRDEEHNITGFVTELHLPATMDKKMHKILKRVAEQCTVKKMIALNPELTVEVVTC